VEISEPNARPPDGFRWTVSDLAVFFVCFGLSIILVPIAAVSVLRLIQPGFSRENMSGVDLILLQGLLDLVLVGFIVLLVKVVHRRSFAATIGWRWGQGFRTGFLIGLGVLIALTVVLLSSFLPSVETPIERLLSSTQAIVLFALFGIGVAPLVEEVIFRGFLFTIFSDLGGPKSAVPYTSLVFAGMHVLQLWGNWGAVALIFGVGYLLGLVRQRSGSVVSSWIVHAAYNGMIFGLAALGMLLGVEERPQ
jgi:membrane protease YdiL (CAAX protease family)